MRFTVIYVPSAEAELADDWNNARDKSAVSAAANRIDQLLCDDPLKHAVPFYGDWLLVEPPLSVVFRISLEDCKVEVLHVWMNE